jgi:glyoxylase-like metal-dependent hydrolase (beta-lactamase superfamily II)
VIVPARGHTPGSVVMFITLSGGARYAFVGDLVWQLEGLSGCRPIVRFAAVREGLDVSFGRRSMGRDALMLAVRRPCVMRMVRSDLRESAIDEQFRSGDVACVV